MDGLLIFSKKLNLTKKILQIKKSCGVTMNNFSFVQGVYLHNWMRITKNII